MEDVLGIYQLPYNKEPPVICMDEKQLQLLGEARERISAEPLYLDSETHLPKPDYYQKIDTKYIRCGTASVFMFTEPLGGWRHVSALQHRTKSDYASMLKKIAEEHYPDCKRLFLFRII